MAIMKFYSGYRDGEVWENDPENPTNLGECIFTDLDGEEAVNVAAMLNSTYLKGYTDGAVTIEVKTLSKDATKEMLTPVLDAFVEMYNYNSSRQTLGDPKESYQKTRNLSEKLWDVFDRVYGNSWRSRLVGGGTYTKKPVTVN